MRRRQAGAEFLAVAGGRGEEERGRESETGEKGEREKVRPREREGWRSGRPRGCETKIEPHGKEVAEASETTPGGRLRAAALPREGRAGAYRQHALSRLGRAGPSHPRRTEPFPAPAILASAELARPLVLDDDDGSSGAA